MRTSFLLLRFPPFSGSLVEDGRGCSFQLHQERFAGVEAGALAAVVAAGCASSFSASGLTSSTRMLETNFSLSAVCDPTGETTETAVWVLVLEEMEGAGR